MFESWSIKFHVIWTAPHEVIPCSLCMYNLSRILGNVRLAMERELNAKGWGFANNFFTYWTTRMRGLKWFESDLTELFTKPTFCFLETVIFSISQFWLPCTWNFEKFFYIRILLDKYLSNEGICKAIGGRLCRANFDREIVDMVCHASRGLGTTEPNRGGFPTLREQESDATKHGMVNPL